MSNPFDWRNQPPKIDWSQLHMAGRISATMSERVNKKREEGKEPSLIGELSAKTASDPRKFVTKKGKK